VPISHVVLKLLILFLGLIKIRITKGNQLAVLKNARRFQDEQNRFRCTEV